MMKKNNNRIQATMMQRFLISGLSVITIIILASCSTTKNIPDDDHLFTGLTHIKYQNYEKTSGFVTAQEEVEAALATAPNGALFGSSYYRTPFPYGLWVWNAFSDKDTKFAKWMTRSFGKQPVLMSWVNPALRASVAQSVLHNHGFFHAKVDYDIIQQRNPKKQKIGYTVDLGKQFLIDTIQYIGFSAHEDSLIAATSDDAIISKNSPFTVASLDAERNRIARLFRNNGYYYYQAGYASYLADTLSIPNKAKMKLQLADSIPEEATYPWYIGRVNIGIRRSFTQEYTDSVSRRSFTFRYSNRKPPLRFRVIMGAMRLRPRQLFNYDNYQETINKLNAMGLFSMTDIKFNPRANTDTLDMTINCILDRPYDFYIESNFVNRTIGRMGPQLKMGLTKRNAFHGGEKLDVNVHGSYEWQSSGNGGSRDSYEYGADASIEFPRIIAPFFGGNTRRSVNSSGTRPQRRRFYTSRSTIAKFSTDIVYRPGYYKMHIVSGEWSYRWQSSANSRHEFSPLTIKYQFMNSHTEKFDTLISENVYMRTMMSDYFIPEMRYTYIYTSPSNYLNPIRWETSISESGNITSLAFAAAGRKWNEKEKKLFKNPYSQHIRLETDFTKTWHLSHVSSLVAHVNVGLLFSYGNSETAPFTELFYAGGANSIRAFNVRTIGPGAFPGIPGHKQMSYIIQNGDFKFIANLEYRRRLFGNLHGAIFLDAGNVWAKKDMEISTVNESGEKVTQTYSDMTFRFPDAFKQLAVGTGIGLRYDLDFLILRLDWGLGLHLPYETIKKGFYNISRFKDSHSLHFAIGYPF